MKTKTQILFQVTLFLAFINVKSQTLTCAYNCPKIGEIFSTKTASPVLHTNGQNQVWNFTQMQAVSNFPVTFTYVDPSTAVSSSLFPQADVLRLEAGIHKFLKIGNNGVKLMSPTSATANAESLLLPLPFSYGSTYTETVITSYINSSNDVIEVTAKKTLNGAATGTLMLPSGTYTDVLRISGTLVETQKTNGVAEQYYYTTALNYYYSEKISHPLLYSFYKSSNGPVDFAPYTQFVSEISTGINEWKVSQFETQVLPNPASDKILIATAVNDDLQLILYNTFGEVVFNKIHNGESQLNVDNLAEGIYTLLISDGITMQSKKIVITR